MWKTVLIMLGCAAAATFTVTGWPRLDRPQQGSGLILTMQNDTYRRVIHVGESPVETLIGAQIAVAPRQRCNGGVHRSRWSRGVVMIITPTSAQGPIDGQPLAEGAPVPAPTPVTGSTGIGQPTVPSSAVRSQTFNVYTSKSYAEEGRLSCPAARAVTRYSLSSGWNVVQADTKDTPGVRYSVVQGAHPQERSIQLASRLIFGR